MQVHSEHIISESEKNEKINVTSPSCGMAKETVHIISRSNKIVSRFLYDDILAALIKKQKKPYYTC